MDRLSSSAKRVIEDGEALVSAASAYELSAKAIRGKLPGLENLTEQFEAICQEQAFGFLPIHVSHALAAAGLTTDHRDPFDRLIAAQSFVEDLAIVTLDPAFKQFGCKTIW